MASVQEFPKEPRLPGDLARADHAVLESDIQWEGLLVDADLSGQVAEDPVISGCRFTGAALVGVELVRARISDTRFERCDLSGAILAKASLTRVEFNDCRLSGADLSGGHFRDLCFRECRLVDVTLRMSSCLGALFEGCDLTRADLYAAELPGAYVLKSKLSEVEMGRATFAGARFHGSSFGNIRGAEALRGCSIASAQILPVALQLLAAWGITVDDDAWS